MSASPLSSVGVGGTLRDGSASQKAVRFALDAAEGLAAETRMSAGAASNLQACYCAARRRSDATIAFTDTLRKAEGIIMASPARDKAISRSSCCNDPFGRAALRGRWHLHDTDLQEQMQPLAEQAAGMAVLRQCQCP